MSGAFAGNFNAGNIVFWNDNFTDLATARDLMVGVEIYIALATPTYTKITDELLTYQLEQIKYSYSSQTNITQTNADLPFNLDVVALGELEI
jgi:hypothetical protein